MPAYILTGTPGSGKTAILRQLEADGFAVAEEAATDVIALRQALGVSEPWATPGLAGQIVELQRRRWEAARVDGGRVVFFDRAPACTLALCRWMGVPPPGRVVAEVERGGYQRTAFFVRQQGFVEPTTARRISFEDSLAFERVHEETYRELGFDLVEVPAGPLPDRVRIITTTISPGRPG
jgi:predicted ATPase